jgi:hypothetical protein
VEREPRQRRIGLTDHEIDLLIYGLYGLTDAEAEMVEKSSGASVTAGRNHRKGRTLSASMR